MSSYLVDTQTLILSFLSPGKLPKKARKIMEDGSADRILSSVSIVEVGIKSRLGKLEISEAELQMAIGDLRLRVSRSRRYMPSGSFACRSGRTYSTGCWSQLLLP